MSSHQLVDLSQLELESNLIEKTPTAAPPIETKPLTAAEHLTQTIRLLKKTIRDSETTEESQGVKVSVQLLEILQRKMDEVSSSQWQLSDQEEQYWQQQLEAVSVMFESNTMNADSHSTRSRHATATRAIEHLEKAADHLRSMADLKIYGGQLCSQILGFGQFRELESNQFEQGDRALVYVEVENHLTQSISDQASGELNKEPVWKTRLRASYTIYDVDGKIAQQETYPLIEDFARQRRRDFYVHLPLTIPSLQPGNYQLSISVEDLGNANVATLTAVPFSVSSPSD